MEPPLQQRQWSEMKWDLSSATGRFSLSWQGAATISGGTTYWTLTCLIFQVSQQLPCGEEKDSDGPQAQHHAHCSSMQPQSPESVALPKSIAAPAPASSASQPYPGIHAGLAAEMRVYLRILLSFSSPPEQWVSQARTSSVGT